MSAAASDENGPCREQFSIEIMDTDFGLFCKHNLSGWVRYCMHLQDGKSVEVGISMPSVSVSVELLIRSLPTLSMSQRALWNSSAKMSDRHGDEIAAR